MTTSEEVEFDNNEDDDEEAKDAAADALVAAVINAIQATLEAGHHTQLEVAELVVHVGAAAVRKFGGTDQDARGATETGLRLWEEERSKVS